MSLFKNSQEITMPGNDAETTVLAKDTKINGRIETSCDLHLDGTFEGDIVSTGLIIIGISGAVKAQVKAEKLVVYGKIEGDIFAKVVEIMPKGIIVGNVTTEEFVIEKEGQFEGESRHEELKVNAINETPKEKVKKKAKKKSNAGNGKKTVTKKKA